MHVYRSDVVGSLLRPAYLREARQRYEAGASSAVEFKQIEDQAVEEAISLQLRAGVDVLSDGELRRYAFFGHLIDAVEGFDKFGGWALPFATPSTRRSKKPTVPISSVNPNRCSVCNTGHSRAS